MYPLRTAIGALHAGTVAKVDLGEVNGRVFVNTASVGAYTDFVAIRERNEKRIGKPLAAVLAAVRTRPRESGTRALPGSER
jgi:undecaprenyl-diphosphatase